MEACLVCLFQQNVKIEQSPGGRDVVKTDCPRCGIFEFTGTAAIMVERSNLSELQRAALSHWIRKSQKADKVLQIGSDIFRKFRGKVSLPRPKEQADNFIWWIGKNVITPDQKKPINFDIMTSIIGVLNRKGVIYVAEYLENKGLVNFGKEKSWIQMTFDGWDRFEELRTGNHSGNIAFMAMEYGNTHLDEIYKKHIKGAVKQTGFDLRRLDEVLKAGLIDNQLRVEIKKCRFLLSDLTFDNNGAYWEAGYAEGLGKPVIYLCEKKHFDEFKTHFDTSHHTSIIWEKETIEDAMVNLKATIRATLPTEAKIED